MGSRIPDNPGWALSVGDEATGTVRAVDDQGNTWEYAIPPGTYITEGAILLAGEGAGGTLRLTRTDGKEIEVEARAVIE